MSIFFHPSFLSASNFLPVATSPSSSSSSSASSSSYESAKACAIVVDADDDGGDNTKDDGDNVSGVDGAASASPGASPVGRSAAGLRNPPPDGTTFEQVPLGRRLSRELPAYGYWNVQLYQSESGYVSLELEVPRGASLGVYARRNALPTHTTYDLMEVVRGSEDVVKRSVKVRYT